MPVTRGFGIVGTGVIAAIHADAIAMLPGAWLAAVTDLDSGAAAAFAAAHGCRAEPGRRVADEPGRSLRRPAPLVHGPARRGHRGVLHAGAPDRGGGHRAGHRQVRLGCRRHHPVQYRGLPRLPAASGDHRDRGNGDGRGRPDRPLRGGRPRRCEPGAQPGRGRRPFGVRRPGPSPAATPCSAPTWSTCR